MPRIAPHRRRMISMSLRATLERCSAFSHARASEIERPARLRRREKAREGARIIQRFVERPASAWSHKFIGHSTDNRLHDYSLLIRSFRSSPFVVAAAPNTRSRDRRERERERERERGKPGFGFTSVQFHEYMHAAPSMSIVSSKTRHGNLRRNEDSRSAEF